MSDPQIPELENIQRSTQENSEHLAASRRGFFKAAGIGAAAWAASSALPGTGLIEKAKAKEIDPPSQNPNQRAAESNQVRMTTSRIESEIIEHAFPHPTNGDEERYRNQAFAGNFSKTLPHDPVTGLVVPSAYTALLNAFQRGT
ncbi:MAG: hypothetical protein J2P49_09010, partial [Methylocapsa sp.]|nr:hypothetical protein [Methylocapsa sp.]